MSRPYLIVAALGLGACTAPGYELMKNNASYEEQRTDVAQCRYEAAAHSNPGYIPPAWSTRHAVAQGTSLAIDQSARQAELMSLCLQAKGWRHGGTTEVGYTPGPASAPPSARPDDPSMIQCERSDAVTIWAGESYCRSIGGSPVAASPPVAQQGGSGQPAR